MDTLHAPRPTQRLRRIKGAEDEASLERLSAIPEIHQALKTRIQVKMLWDVCQVPDFRNLTIDTHVKLLQDIWRTLIMGGGSLSDDFMSGKIKRCDDISGGVDQLSSRLAQIRTWTYCASKPNWMRSRNIWINHAREVEDKLSDALHEALTARFVDRRTRKLLKGIGANLEMSATIKDSGEVYIEDDLIGHLDGLTFTIDSSQTGLEAQALQAAAEKAVGPEIDRILTSISSGTHAIFTLSDKGEILWGGKAIGRIAASGSIFAPDAELIGGTFGKPVLQQMASDRMREFLKAEVQTHLTPLKALKGLIDSADTLPAAKGFGYVLFENNGAIERRDHLQAVRDLDQDARRQLRSVSVIFGHYNVYLSDLTKPKPARLLSLLVAFGAGGDKKPWIPFAGVTSIPNEGELDAKHYSAQALSLAGYRAVGGRIIRFDILNRLAFLIRDAQTLFKTTKKDGVQGHKFQIMSEMLALLGSTYEDVQGVLRELGYKSETASEPLTRPISEPTENPSSDPTPAPEAETEKKDDTPIKSETSTSAEKETSKQDTSEPAAPDVETKDPDIIAPDIKAPATIEIVKAETTAPTETVKNPSPKKAKAKKVISVYQHRETLEDGTIKELENLEYWYFPSRGQKGFRPKNNAGFKGNRKQKPFKGNKSFKNNKGANKAPSQKQIENSPFAALASLKNNKKD